MRIAARLCIDLDPGGLISAPPAAFNRSIAEVEADTHQTRGLGTADPL